MRRLPDTQFDIQWLPFQLNAQASKTGVNKVEMYMQKFGRTREQVMQMSAGMKANFSAVGLPFSFSDKALTGNTFNSHRLIAKAYTKGEAVQDKVVEALFRAYFAEEKFLNDREVLQAAAVEAGFDPDEAKAFVESEDSFAEETIEELKVGQAMGVTGVPYFVMSSPDTDQKAMAISGAQPPEVFQKAAMSIGKLP